MDSLLRPIKCVGYNEKKEKNGVEQTAEDALDYINPEAIKGAIEEVKTAVKTCCDHLTYNGLGGNALRKKVDKGVSVSGKTLLPRVDEIADNVTAIPAQIEAVVDPLYDMAIQKHDEFQKKFNDHAHNNVQGQSTTVEDIQL